jgi:transcriptional regulator with XRE-family HTH domain
MTKLRLLREEKDLLQREVAEKLHVSQGTLSLWESGTHTPDIDSLYALADLYDTSLDYMLGYSANRMIDSGKPERLLLEYLGAAHDFPADAEQRGAVAEAISLAVKMLQMK